MCQELTQSVLDMEMDTLVKIEALEQVDSLTLARIEEVTAMLKGQLTDLERRIPRPGTWQELVQTNIETAESHQQAWQSLEKRIAGQETVVSQFPTVARDMSQILSRLSLLESQFSSVKALFPGTTAPRAPVQPPSSGPCMSVVSNSPDSNTKDAFSLECSRSIAELRDRVNGIITWIKNFHEQIALWQKSIRHENATRITQ